MIAFPDAEPKEMNPSVDLSLIGSEEQAPNTTVPIEEFTLGIDPKSLDAMVLMQMVYNAVVRHSGGFLKHMAISVVKKVKITAA